MTFGRLLLLRRLITMAALLVSFAALFQSRHFETFKLAVNWWNPLSISEYRLRMRDTKDYEADIQAALDENNAPEAQEIAALALQYGHHLNEDLLERTRESPVDVGLRYAWDFGSGAVTGDVHNAVSMSGAMAADYFIIGDVRDVFNEGRHLVLGQDCDEIVLGLALAGIVTLAPGTGPIDASLSVLKNLKRAKKIAAPLTNSLGRAAVRVINREELARAFAGLPNVKFRMPSPTALWGTLGRLDWKNIKRGDFSSAQAPLKTLMPVDTDDIARQLKGAVNPEAVDELMEFTASTQDMVRNAGLMTAVEALQKAENAQEIARFQKLAKGMKESTATAIKILGKTAIRLGDLVWTVVMALAGAFVWLTVATWTTFSIVRQVRRLNARKRPA